jgi:hypothetical protein
MSREPKHKIPEGHSIHIKWPQMLTSGKRVTLEQAFEIIRRTDTMITDPDGGFGNNKRYVDAARRVMGMQPWFDLQKEWMAMNPTNPSGEKTWWWDMGWALREIIKKSLGHIETEYVHNTWCSSSYIGGPYGWCHPNGIISYTANIGKWPSLDEVIVEWEDLAEAFPFIDLAVSLKNHEEGYVTEGVEPVATSNFRVANGKIEFLDSDKGLHETNMLGNGDAVDKFVKGLNDPFREQGLSPEFVEQVGVIQRPTIAKICAVARDLYERDGWKYHSDSVSEWVVRCQEDLDKIDMNQAPQHAVIHEKFITEAGIKFPYLKAPEKQNDEQG